MDKRFLAVLGAIIVVFIGVFALNQKSSTTTTNSGSQATNHVTSQGANKVALVEYGDYECSVCLSFYQPMKDAVAQTSKDVYFQFRNLPLSQIHLNAMSSARAAEAAGLQGKYWEMHDQLYENQDPSGQAGWVASKNALEDYYVKFADKIGLNQTQFRQDYASNKVNDYINADTAEFDKTGQQKATPTFFLDGKYIENSQFVDDKTGQVSVAKIVALLNSAVANKK